MKRVRLVRLATAIATTAALTAGVLAVPSTVTTAPAAAVGAVRLTGYGADSCTAPSESQMRAFWTNTPYSYWGIYIGGGDRGCAQPNLTRTWVSDVVSMGWGLLPIWVGRQNPCTPGQAVYFSRNTTTAYYQGKAEAVAAKKAWSVLSSARYVPFDLDIEAPSSMSASCRAAAKAFVHGWDRQMKARPVAIAGVYTSVCAGHIDDFAYLESRPDFIDGADWDGVPSVGTLSCVYSNHWVNHWRHKQYRGGHNATYNHVTLNIDSRCADAPVYGARTSLSATDPCARTYRASTTAAASVDSAAAQPVSWHGALWRAGGPLDSLLQRAPIGTSAAMSAWTPVSVAGTRVVNHDVSPQAPTIGAPLVLRDGSLVVPVTRHDASGAAVVLYSTTDGTHFTRRSTVPISATLGAGVAVPTTASAGTAVLVLDPSGVTTQWSATHGTARFTSAGLGGAPSAVVMDSADTGRAVVETSRCGGGTCTPTERVYRTSDGGRTWKSPV